MNFFKTTKFLIPTAALTLIGTLLRIPEVYHPISDELASMLLFHFPTSWESLLFNYSDLNQRALNILLAKLSMGIFGENEFALRLPALLSGIIALPLAYRVGVLINGSKVGAWIGALILTFSLYHVSFIRDYRGYSLTVFLSLIIIFIIYKLLNRKNFTLWGIIFFLVGFGMILTLPTNVHFLAGVGIFYIIVILSDRKNEPYSSGSFVKLTWPFILLFGFICGYFLYILEGIKFAISEQLEYRKIVGQVQDVDVSFNFERVTDVFTSLILPWNSWLYIFLIIGLVRLYKTKGFILFVSLIVLPIVMTILTGLMGPPRVYIYWLPFIMLLVGFGIAEFLTWVKFRFSNTLAYGTGIIILTIIVFYSLGTYTHHLSKGYSLATDGMARDRIFILPPKLGSSSFGWGTTFEEAKAAKTYIDNYSSRNDLIIVPYFDKVLRYYLDETIAHNMLNILQEGQLNKIMFLGSSKMPPYEIPHMEAKGSIEILKNHSFKVIENFGNLRLYDLDFSIKKLVPSNHDRDYENHLDLRQGNKTQIDHVKQPRIAGKEALMVRQSGNQGTAISRQIKMIENKKEGSFILVNFATDYDHHSEAGLLFPKNNLPIGDNYWNSLNGVFISRESKFDWERVDPYRNYSTQSDLLRGKGTEFAWQIKFVISPITGEKIFFLARFVGLFSVSACHV